MTAEFLIQRILFLFTAIPVVFLFIWFMLLLHVGVDGRLQDNFNRSEDERRAEAAKPQTSVRVLR